jgi:hypothetical protein
LVTRIAIGKGVGFLVGLIGFIFLPYFLPEAGWLIRWGILLWYTTLGAIIGVFGVCQAKRPQHSYTVDSAPLF